VPQDHNLPAAEFSRKIVTKHSLEFSARATIFLPAVADFSASHGEFVVKTNNHSNKLSYF
jgi:hypothetical protein